MWRLGSKYDPANQTRVKQKNTSIAGAARTGTATETNSNTPRYDRILQLYQYSNRYSSFNPRQDVNTICSQVSLYNEIINVKNLLYKAIHSSCSFLLFFIRTS